MKRFSRPGIFPPASGILPAFLLVCAVQGAQAQTTTWDAATASWTAPDSWTSGEPQSGEDFFINNGGTAEITAGIAAVGNIGTLGELNGQSGSLSISAGSLTLSSELRIGDEGEGAVTLNGAAQVNATGVVLGRQAAGAGTLNLDGGLLTTGQVSSGGGSGHLSFDGGTLRLSAAQADLFHGLETVGLGSGGGTLDTQSFDAVTDTAFEGAGGLTKTGAGTLTLTGTSTYAGTTTVEAGMLMVDGMMRVDGEIANDVVVRNGAALGGDGVVGDIVLESGAVLVPIGCFDGDSLTWQSGATIVYELGDSYGILELLGTLAKDGDGDFDFTFHDDGWQVGYTYSLIFFEDTTFDENDFGFTNGGGFAGTFILEDDALRFKLTAIPEPSACALGLAGLLAAFAASRRRASASG